MMNALPTWHSEIQKIEDIFRNVQRPNNADILIQKAIGEFVSGVCIILSLPENVDEQHMPSLRSAIMDCDDALSILQLLADKRLSHTVLSPLISLSRQTSLKVKRTLQKHTIGDAQLDKRGAQLHDKILSLL